MLAEQSKDYYRIYQLKTWKSALATKKKKVKFVDSLCELFKDK